MFLQHKANADLLEVLDLEALFDPSAAQVRARFHAGEEMPEADDYAKADLLFPSGESLPRCWLDANYKA
jgi:hypothetical protein